MYIPTRVKNDIHYERRDGSLKEERVCVDYKCAKKVTISTHTNTHTHTVLSLCSNQDTCNVYEMCKKVKLTTKIKKLIIIIINNNNNNK